MMEIILDVGSGNTCRNDLGICQEMTRRIAEIDNHRHTIILKAQLFQDQPPNIPLSPHLFRLWRNYAGAMGYEMTASVFDVFSLQQLLVGPPPAFVKIANRRDLDWLIGEIPRKIAVYKSVPPPIYWSGNLADAGFMWAGEKVLWLLCVTAHPAMVEEYGMGPDGTTAYGLSDHTVGLDLIQKHRPKIYECHFVLEHDPENLDGGPWAKTPDQLRQILGMEGN